MANAIKKISVQRGYDVTRYTLNCFGGAGGQHACLVADALGMTSVLIHPFSSLLSAYGMGLADIRSVREQAIEEPFGDKARTDLARTAQQLARAAIAEVAGQGVATPKIKLYVRAHIRYAGTDTALIVDAGTLPCRGRVDAPRQRCVGGGVTRRAHPTRRPAADDLPPPGGGESSLQKCNQRSSAPTARGSASSIAANSSCWKRSRSRRSAAARGFASRCRSRRARRCRSRRGGRGFSPAVNGTARWCLRARRWRPATRWRGRRSSSSRIRPSWSSRAGRTELTAKNHLVLRRVKKLARARAIGTKADPVMLEVFNNFFMSIAEQMGVALQNTASSVNIKERLDFSCAVFDGDGALVANAPHMPVHLGSMDRAVETIIRENKGADPAGRRLRDQRAV